MLKDTTYTFDVLHLCWNCRLVRTGIVKLLGKYEERQQYGDIVYVCENKSCSYRINLPVATWEKLSLVRSFIPKVVDEQPKERAKKVR